MPDLTRAIPVGVQQVKFHTFDPTPFDRPGTLDGLVLCQIGEHSYDVTVAVKMALAVLELAAENPGLLAQHQRAQLRSVGDAA